MAIAGVLWDQAVNMSFHRAFNRANEKLENISLGHYGL